MKNRNILRCPYCGAAVLTDAKERHCYKCETKMKFIEKEDEYKRKQLRLEKQK